MQMPAMLKMGAPVALLMPLRILQTLLAVVIAGLTLYVSNWYNSETLTASPSQINFLVFVAVWTLLVNAYLALSPRFAKKLVHPYATFGLTVATTLFYFAGFIALAVFLGKLLFCRGSVCGAARAATVFAALQFVLFASASVILGLETFRGGFRAAQANSAKMAAMREVGVGA